MADRALQSGARLAALIATLAMPVTAAAQPTVRLVQVGGDAALLRSTEVSLEAIPVAVEREQRADLSLDALVQAPPPPTPEARVLIVLDAPARALLVVVDDRRARFQIRVFERVPGEEDILAEQLAAVARTSVEAILGNEGFGDPLDDALARLRALEAEARMLREAEPPPLPPPGVLVSGELAYGGTLFGDEPIGAHGPLVGLALGTAKVRGVLRVGYRFGESIDAAELSGTLDRLTMRLGIDGSLLEDTVALRLGLAGGLDVVLPRLRVEVGTANELSAAVDPLLQLGAEVAVTLAPQLALALRVGADIAFGTVRYVVLDGIGAPQVLTRHWALRPFATLGLRVF